MVAAVVRALFSTFWAAMGSAKGLPCCAVILRIPWLSSTL